MKIDKADPNNEVSNLPKIFTVAQLNEEYGMSPTTQWREREKGRLSYRRFGAGKVVYTEADILEYLESRKGAKY